MAAKRKLVVIGNGMAGARTVEEILARGGGDQFQITMFGDEPTGNYNRILLSNVLNGSYQEDEIFLNSLEWYRENNIHLHAGLKAAGLLRRAKLVRGRSRRLLISSRTRTSDSLRKIFTPAFWRRCTWRKTRKFFSVWCRVQKNLSSTNS